MADSTDKPGGFSPHAEPWRYVIVGDGAAGITAAQTLRRHDPQSRITLVADDPHPAYFRAALTNYLIGELQEAQIWAVPPGFYDEYQISRIHGRAQSIDPAGKHLTLAGHDTRPVDYDALLIASGARAKPPPFRGGALPGIMTMRTLQDVRRVMDQVQLENLQQAVIIGGGPLGLEWAQGLHTRGVAVSYLLRGDRLLPQVLDKTASDLTLARLRLAGVDVRLHEEVVEAIAGPDGRVAGVYTNRGERIDCTLAGVAIGVQCNSEWLAGSGIDLDEQGAVLVDRAGRTSAAGIYAAGDVASVAGTLRQLWEPARRQGQVAALNMKATLNGTGPEASYDPGAFYFATRLFDLDFAAVGDLSEAGNREIQLDFPRRGEALRYRKLLLREGRLVGALLLGERKEQVRRRGRLFKRLIDAEVDVQAISGRLLDPHFDLAAWLDRAWSREKPAAVSAAVSPATLRGTQQLPRPMPSPAAAPLIPDTQPAAQLILEGGRSWPLKETIILGRDPQNDVTLEDPAVSYAHAQITHHQAHGQNHYYLLDLGSRNGTFVNEEAITIPRRLQDGDQIRLGRTVFRFRLPAGDHQPSQPSPVPAGRLHVIRGPETGQSRPINKRTIIGRRAGSCDMVITDRAVSGRHIAVFPRPDGVYAQDLGSANGTLLNGRQLGREPVKLSAGDELHLGHETIIRLEII